MRRRLIRVADKVREIGTYKDLADMLDKIAEEDQPGYIDALLDALEGR